MFKLLMSMFKIYYKIRWIGILWSPFYLCENINILNSISICIFNKAITETDNLHFMSLKVKLIESFYRRHIIITNYQFL